MVIWFLDGVRFFLNADPDRGFAPIAGGGADWCGFFLFLAVGGWSAWSLLVRMGAERRFASLVRIAAPMK